MSEAIVYQLTNKLEVTEQLPAEPKLDELETVAAAIQHVRLGGIILISDSENREDEADLMVAAEHVTPEILNLYRQIGGVTCLAVNHEIKNRLRLKPLADGARPKGDTNFMTKLDHIDVKSGISPEDRALTIKWAANPLSRYDDFTDGHQDMLGALDLSKRQGHTEASVAIAELAGLEPAAAISELVDDNGNPAKGNNVERTAHKLGIPRISIEGLIGYLQRVRHI